MNVNIPEILVANGAGAVIVIFLLIFRVRQQQSSQIHERLFSTMLISVLVAIVGETTSFVIDGQMFRGCVPLQYLSNMVCLGLTEMVGFLWCLFVDYRIYCSMKRLKRKAIILGVPVVLITLFLIGDLFGNGFIFIVNPENCYVRGRWNILIYIGLCIYFAETIVNVFQARRKGIMPFFFPVYCFVVPCMVGVVIQGAFYGLAVGWLTTAMAAVFVYLELQTKNFYLDGISGLFNRQYMNYHLSQAAQHGRKLHGIMLDVNDFKLINDAYGHAMGDRAIQTMGNILSQSVFHNAVAMRMGGDEFVVILTDSTDEECKRQMEAIQNTIDRFNNNENELFDLSASMGSAHFDGQTTEEFLAQMDRAMYEVKREYHKDSEV